MRARGFSLIEVLVGILILGIVITTSLAVFVERNRRLAQASETITAYQALANESEYQRRIAYGSLGDGDFQTEPAAILDPLKPYTAKVKVKSTEPNVKNVTLTITWKNGQRKAEMTVVRVNTGGDTLW